jgi:ABC-type transporter Mla subunit MlaD
MNKEVAKKLLKIAENQQKMIEKLAQQLQEFPAPVHPNLREAETILNALPAPIKSVVLGLEVHQSSDPNFDGEVKVKFAPGKASDVAFNAVQKTVQNLAARNMLPGASYAVKEMA